MPLTEQQVEAKARAEYERFRRESSGGLRTWEQLSAEEREGYLQAFREAGASKAGVPSRVYIQESRPTAPNAPALWVPVDQSGAPAPMADWQVYV